MTAKDDRKNAFDVTFECLNCGRRWQQTFKTGDRVTTGWRGTRLESGRCTHDMGCRECHLIQCPSCESDEDVKVLNREPR